MAWAMQTSVFFALLLGVTRAQFYPFCIDGIAKAEFSDGSPVEVILAQAPLFSTNAKVGQKLGLLNLFHSSIVLVQGEGSARHYWTLEFDFTGHDVLNSIVPKIAPNASLPGGVSLTWENDARFCLTEGLKWGQGHWSKRFDVVTTLTADQAGKVFSDFVAVANSTEHNVKSQYQLWHVAKTGFFGGVRQTFVPDLTCNDGAVWFLNYLASTLNAPFPTGFTFRGTSVVLKAHSVSVVDTSDPAQVTKMVQYFNLITDVISANKSVGHRLLDVAMILLERKYVYDSNSQVYYELYGSFLPWVEFKYAEYPLAGPPWMKSREAALAQSSEAVSTEDAIAFV